MRKALQILAGLTAALMVASCTGDDPVKGDGWGTNPSPEVPSGRPEGEYGSTQDWHKGSLKVMSFNVRYENSGDGANIWPARSKGVYAMLRSEMPIVMGTQECKWSQRADILANCPRYDAIGVCRDDGKEESSSETMTIFYLRDSVRLEKWGTFWLSDSPDIPSKGWDGACYRCATWGVFKKVNGGNRFFYVNTHIDHKGAVAKQKGVELVVRKMNELNSEMLPAILTADFNMKYDDAGILPARDNLRYARTTSGVTDNTSTYQGFGTTTGSIIDHIFYRGFKSCIKYRCINDSWDGVTYISDHYPIYAILEF